MGENSRERPVHNGEACEEVGDDDIVQKLRRRFCPSLSPATDKAAVKDLRRLHNPSLKQMADGCARARGQSMMCKGGMQCVPSSRPGRWPAWRLISSCRPCAFPARHG